VPDKIGIVGYDGIAETKHSSPPLTTIKPDLEEAGRLLVAQVLGDDDDEPAMELLGGQYFGAQAFD